MNGAVRGVGLAVIAGVFVGGWLWVRGEPETNGTGAAHAATAGVKVKMWQSSQQCKSCHQKVWDEWYGSHHQIAYTNPEVRRLSEDFRIKDCQACHLPRQVALTGFGKRSLPRQTRPNEGVDCITCHLAADGTIMGKRDMPKAPCAPKANADFASVNMCASCHNQHQTTDQWRASKYAKEGKTCHDCHMGKFGHGFNAAHDTAMLRAAGELTVEFAAGELKMTLFNKGAGHNFPTEERHRALDIEYGFPDAKGEVATWQRAYRFRQPYRDEPGENTQLPAMAKKSVSAKVPEGAERAKVRLWYRLNPFAKNGDKASTLLEEKEISLR